MSGSSLPGLAIARPVTTLMICCAVLMLGTVSFGNLSVDLLPEVATPRITLATRAEGLAPREVERLITVPLEDAVRSVAGVRRLTSTSRDGMSVITAVFPWGINLDLTLLRVRDAVERARVSLPLDLERPAVLRWDPGGEPVLGLAVSAEGSLDRLREMVEAVVVPRMEQVRGIAGAHVTGGSECEIQVLLDPARMELHGVSVADVERALQAANQSLRGGTIVQGTLRYSVRAVGEFQAAPEIGGVRVGPDPRGAPVRIVDIARVREGSRPRRAGAFLNGAPAIGVLLYKEAGTNTVEAVAAAEDALVRLREQYPTVSFAVAFENASFIRDAISSVVQNIALGSLCAFVVLFLFLRDPRNPLLIGIAIPISIVATLVLCYFAGITLNLMTLGGLAIGAGLLVDNSIVVLENTFRHREEGRGVTEAARRGADDVAPAVTAATFTTIAVFLPIAYVSGVAGELFSAQAWTVTFALLASLLVSLSLLPMLASKFLRAGDWASEAPSEEGGPGAPATDGGPATTKESEGDGAGALPNRLRGRAGDALDLAIAIPLFWVRAVARSAAWVLRPVASGFALVYGGFARGYHEVLTVALRHRVLTLAGVVALLVLGVGISLRLPWELMPSVDTGRFEVIVDAPPGTPFARLEQMVLRLDEAARGAGSPATTFAAVGSESVAAPGTAAGAMELSPTRATLTVVAGRSESGRVADPEAIIASVRAAASDVAGANVVVDAQVTPLQRLLRLEAGGIDVELFGDDLYVNSSTRRLPAAPRRSSVVTVCG